MSKPSRWRVASVGFFFLSRVVVRTYRNRRYGIKDFSLHNGRRAGGGQRGGLGRRRSGVVLGVGLVLHGRPKVVGGATEFPETLAQAAGEVRKLGGAEHHQRDDQNDADFPEAEAEHSNEQLARKDHDLSTFSFFHRNGGRMIQIAADLEVRVPERYPMVETTCALGRVGARKLFVSAPILSTNGRTLATKPVRPCERVGSSG
jgi:hypothetical protein